MLINCVVYREGKKLADIAVDDISEYIHRPDCFVWVALHDATPQELEQMREEFDLHELAIEDARHGHQRPKIEEYGTSLFVVMQLVEFAGDTPEALNVGEMDVFVGPNYVLSVRNRSNEGFLAVRQRAESEPELLRHGSGFVLYALMDAVVDRYFPIIDRLEDDLENIEEDIFRRGSPRSSIERLYQLKRQVMVLRHAVAPLLEASGRLQGGRVPPVVAGTQEYLRDVVDHLTRVNASIESIRDTVATAIQVNLSLTTIEENDVTKKLASWAAIFAVWTALAGIWGMNFAHMPELEWRYGYAFALGTMAVACGVLYRRLRRARWL
jgi:magnesium transporter